LFFDIFDENRLSEEVIRWNVEESLNLSSVKINCEYAVRASFGNEIGDKLR